MIALILAASMSAVVFFQSNMISSVNSESEKTVISLLSDNANQVKCVLDSQISSIWAHMDIIDKSLGAMDSMTEKETVTFLTDILPHAYEVALVTEDGAYIDQDGKKSYIIPDNDDFRLFLDRERICVLRQEVTEDTLMFGTPTAPVLVDGTTYSFVLAYFRLNDLMEILSVESFAGKGQIRVLNSDGFVIMSSDNIDRDKTSYYFFKVYQNAHFMDNDVYADFDGFRESVLKGENYAVHVVLNEDNDHVISYARTEQLNWYVTIVVDYESVLGGLEKNVHTIGTTSILFTVAVVIIALVLVSFISADVHKIRQEKQQLQELNASLDNAKQVAEQALEIAESANKAKSFFLSNMSHDIRTPINAITGLTTLLSKSADNPEKVLEYTRKISSSSHHLLGLINDVLDMSKIESGTTTLSLSEEKIGDIIADLDTMIRPQMNARGHTFHIAVQNVVHEKIIVDKTRFNQILMNLLTNAVKYTPDGGWINLTISETNSSQNTAWYEIVVSDNGYGMSPEFVKTIFDSFSREEDSRTSRIQGTGLGMAITKHLVDLMGGSIEVQSQKGVGSVFTLNLQFHLGDNDETPDFWENFGISRCLLVDEEEAVCQSVALAMENTGVLVDYSLSADNALRKIQSSEPCQLVLLDSRLPTADILELAQQLRSLYPEHPPLLLLTGMDYADLPLQKLESIIDGVLLKPFFISTLKQKLTDIFEQQQERLEEKPSEVSSIFCGRRILVAEDIELNSAILRELLADYDASCVICENGRLALETFEKSAPGTFDFIFMDVQMPVMNGYETTKAIRASSHPDAKSIPIIAMTADAFAEDVKTALQSGMDAHISKPVNITVMEDTVRQVLEGKAFHRR